MRYSAILKEQGLTRDDVLAKLNKVAEEAPLPTVVDNVKAADDALSAATEKVRKALGDVEDVVPGGTKEHIDDVKHLKQGLDDHLEPLAADEWWLTRGYPALDEIERAAKTQAAKPELRWGNLPKESQEYLTSYIDNVTGQMGDARYASTRFAEYGRDAEVCGQERCEGSTCEARLFLLSADLRQV